MHQRLQPGTRKDVLAGARRVRRCRQLSQLQKSETAGPSKSPIPFGTSSSPWHSPPPSRASVCAGSPDTHTVSSGALEPQLSTQRPDTSMTRGGRREQAARDATRGPHLLRRHPGQTCREVVHTRHPSTSQPCQSLPAVFFLLFGQPGCSHDGPAWCQIPDPCVPARGPRRLLPWPRINSTPTCPHQQTKDGCRGAGAAVVALAPLL